MAKVYIECENCGKVIEQKMGRTLCIKCSNDRYHRMQKERRENPEYKEMYMRKYKGKI